MVSDVQNTIIIATVSQAFIKFIPVKSKKLLVYSTQLLQEKFMNILKFDKSIDPFGSI